MGKIVDLTGQTFGRLKVIKYAGRAKNRKALWECECSCSNHTHVIVQGANLRNGNTKSCGCLGKENFNRYKHGYRHTRLYGVWCAMKSRCFNQNNKNYHNYGGRGITVCDEWSNDFMNFYNWAISNGYQENLTIDRIEVNGDYEPFNCRWTTFEVQANNTRANKYITYNNETLTQAQWDRKTGLPISERIERGWSIEKAFNTPIDGRLTKYEYQGRVYTVAELSRLSNIPYPTLYRRLVLSNWPVDKAINYIEIQTERYSEEN